MRCIIKLNIKGFIYQNIDVAVVTTGMLVKFDRLNGCLTSYSAFNFEIEAPILMEINIWV